jgi:hypothetical protein
LFDLIFHPQQEGLVDKSFGAGLRVFALHLLQRAATNNQQTLVEGSKLYRPEFDVFNRSETIADLAKIAHS